MPNLSIHEVTPYPGIGSAEWTAAPQVYLRLNYFSEGGDDTPPVIALVSPTAGQQIARMTPMVVDVTDATKLRRVFLVARFPGLGIAEVIYDGDGFETAYAGQSSLQSIAGGFRFSVLRAGGWPIGAAVELKCFAIDVDGNET